MQSTCQLGEWWLRVDGVCNVEATVVILGDLNLLMLEKGLREFFWNSCKRRSNGCNCCGGETKVVTFGGCWGWDEVGPVQTIWFWKFGW